MASTNKYIVTSTDKSWRTDAATLWKTITSSYNTGTANCYNGSRTIYGLGTSWTSSLVGYYFALMYPSGGKIYIVASVTSPTQLELTTAFDETTIAGASYVIGNAFTTSSEPDWQDDVYVGDIGTTGTLKLTIDYSNCECGCLNTSRNVSTGVTLNIYNASGATLSTFSHVKLSTNTTLSAFSTSESFTIGLGGTFNVNVDFGGATIGTKITFDNSSCSLVSPITSTAPINCPHNFLNVYGYPVSCTTLTISFVCRLTTGTYTCTAFLLNGSTGYGASATIVCSSSYTVNGGHWQAGLGPNVVLNGTASFQDAYGSTTYKSVTCNGTAHTFTNSAAGNVINSLVINKPAGNSAITMNCTTNSLTVKTITSPKITGRTLTLSSASAWLLNLIYPSYVFDATITNCTNSGSTLNAVNGTVNTSSGCSVMTTADWAAFLRRKLVALGGVLW